MSKITYVLRYIYRGNSNYNRKGLVTTMNKQIERLRFHIRMTLFFLREKFFPISLAKVLESPELTEFTKEDVDELREMNELLEQEDEEYVRSEPILVPKNTMYFGGGKSKRKVNCLNASRYRTDIQQACTWALSHGINVFVVNYARPIGLLALETLLDLRRAGETFQLYVDQITHIRHMKSYRLIRETDIEIIFMLSQCDYRFQRLTILERFDKISSRVGYRYNEDGIHIDKTNLEGCEDG